jgi:DNA-binding transcriptional regulator/RsmH inhibitor MraZ
MKNVLFYGTYQHKVDSKGRVSIPAEWRKHLNGCCFKIEDCDCCEIEFWKDLTKTPQEDLKYYYKHNIDKEGRIIFKDKRNMVTILKGCGDYFTIEFRD